MPKLNSVIDASGDAFARNAAHNRALVDELRAKVAQAALGGSRAPANATPHAVSCCPASGSSACWTLVHPSWRSASSRPATFMAAKRRAQA
ncbi:hypothetical protein ACRAWD_05055 [Caulobacter segnis]